MDIVIPTHTKYLELIGNIGEQLVNKLDGYDGDKEALAYHLNLVLTEATANAIKHAPDQSQGTDTIRISICIDDNQLNIKVFDHGQGFDLEAVPLPDFDQPKESGMGLFLIKNIMDSVCYTKMPQHNVLEICKTL